MSTWKKVALAEDIATFAGGEADLLSGASGSVITVDSDGDGFDFLPADVNGKILVADNDSWDAYSFVSSNDIAVDVDATLDTVKFDIIHGSIDNSALDTDAVRLINIDGGTFTTGTMDGRLLYWDDNEDPAVLDIGGAGEILTCVDVNGQLLPQWASAGNNTTITINNGASNGDVNFGILFGSEADLAGAGEANKVYTDGLTDNYSLSYNPGITSVSHAGEGSDSAGNNNSAALYSEYGFAGDLAGTATAAKFVETTNAGSSSATYYPALLGSSASQTNSERVDVHGGIVYEVTGSTTGDLTINGNLTVVGSSTKVEIQSEELQIADGRILLAHTDGGTTYSDQLQANFGNKGIGIVIDNAGQGNDDANDKLAKFVYMGHKSSTNFQNSESVLGWKIAQENNNTANSNVALEGVATMRVGTTPGGNGVASYTMNTSGGTSNINVGIGAMYWGGTGSGGGLWIQTGV